MITAIRSAVLCDKVTLDEHGRMNQLGLWGNEIAAETQPGVVETWLSLLFDIDMKATTGQIRVNTLDFSWGFPFSVPAGVTVKVQCSQLVLPILRPSPLTVAVYDDARKGKPFRLKWDVVVDPAAVVLDEEVGNTVIDAARHFYAEHAPEAVVAQTKH